MTPAQQKKAIALLKRGLAIKEAFENGEGVDANMDDKHTNDIRIFLIQIGEKPDRRTH